MKSKKQLESFTEYCKKYPEQRFWQALRNWSGAYFVYTSDGQPLPDPIKEAYSIHDTFYNDHEENA